MVRSSIFIVIIVTISVVYNIYSSIKKYIQWAQKM